MRHTQVGGQLSARPYAMTRMYTCMVAAGGGIFAKTAKTPPLQSDICRKAGSIKKTAWHITPRCYSLREIESVG